MSSNLFIFITNVFVPLVSLHAALKDFLFRFPTTLWIMSLAGLLLILLFKASTNDNKSSAYKGFLLILLPLGLFSAFLEVGQTPLTKLQFKSLHKFLSFFEEQRQSINLNSRLIQYYERAYSSPRQPVSALHEGTNSFNVNFKDKQIFIKENEFKPGSQIDICQKISLLRIREIYENLKSNKEIRRLAGITLEEVLSLKNICQNSANYVFLASLLMDINAINSLKPKTDEFYALETAIYKKLSSLQIKSLLNESTPDPETNFSDSSLLSVGSTGEVLFYEVNSKLSEVECKKIVSEELGFGSLLPFQSQGRDGRDKEIYYLFYPTGMFSSIYLLDKNNKKTLLLNRVNEDQRSFCFIKFRNGIASIKMAEVAI